MSNASVAARTSDVKPGRVFNSWTVVAYVHRINYEDYWKCLCVCGNTSVCKELDLLKGRTKCCRSCGTKTHGLSYSSEYSIWHTMRARCFNKSSANYHCYGARGITVCDRWRYSFENFFEDMGPRPSDKFQLDRENNDGNYEPTNCRWATPTEQSRNKRTNCFICIAGVVKTVAEWAEIYRVPRGRIYDRLRYGWDPVKAVTEPSRRPRYQKKHD